VSGGPRGGGTRGVQPAPPMKRQFSYPIVREVERTRSDAPPADGEPVARPRNVQRERVLESLLRHPGRGSAAKRH
jgi:hypothetical protein